MVFVPLSIFLTVLTGLWCYGKYKETTSEILTTQHHCLLLADQTVQNNLNRVLSDLTFLTRQRALSEFLETGEDASRKAVEHDWVSFSASISLYDQIRLLDAEGIEVIRVNFGGGSPYVVPAAQLQQKSGRPYVKETWQLGAGEIYVSPLDLNVEQGRVEIPIKPVLRVGTPVLDHSGNRKGMVILNYLGEILLEDVRKSSLVTDCHLMLLNDEGFWLLGVRPEDEWGFMFDDRKDRTFAHDYPDAWQIMSAAKSGQFYTPQGIFTFTTLVPFESRDRVRGEGITRGPARPGTSDPQEKGAPQWKLVSWVPQATLTKTGMNIIRRYVPLLAVFLVVTAGGVWLWAVSVERRRRAEEELRKAHDELEERVEERTLELHRSNEQLREEIAERTLTEEALQMSEERFRSTFEQAAVGIAHVAPDGTWLRVNQKLCDIVGYAREELLPKTFQDITYPDDLETDLKHVAQMLTGEIQTYSMEKRYIRKDGSLVWINLTVSLVRDASEAPDYFISVVEDISRRKSAEQSLVRLATVLEQAAESVMITDTDANIEYVNPAFERITGYSREEVMGKNPRLLRGGERDNRFYKQMWDTLRRGEVWAGRLISKKKDGTLFQEQATISPVRDAAGTVVNYVAVKRDVTQEVELEKQLYKAQKMEAIGTLAGGIAHDFNNLLTVTSGYAELLLLEMKEEDPGYSDLQKVLHASRRGAELVKNLLTFSRKQETEFRPLNLNHEVKQMADLLARSIPKMVDIQLQLGDRLKTIDGDSGQIGQILMNLGVNAGHAMPDGGRLTITTGNVSVDEAYSKTEVGCTPGEYVALTVADTGHGMDQETLEHIFEPFFTTKAPGEGTGLGLATVYGIVKKHGGYIACHSSRGQGTVFQIYFPIAEEILFEPGKVGHSTAPPGGSETILLVDDEEFVRDLGVKLLRGVGYGVIAAASGSEALEAYIPDQKKISLVILDFMMPQMSGKDCLARLLKVNSSVKVLIATGFAVDRPTREAIEAGAKGFVSKPFDLRQLLGTVRKVLDEA